MEPEYKMEDILRRHFGCKKVFLKRPRVIGRFIDSEEKEYQYMTDNGNTAYEKLIDLIEELGVLLGARETAERWVKELDRITSEG